MGGKEGKRRRERPRKGKGHDARDKRVEEGLKERAADVSGQPPTGDLPAAGGEQWGGWGGLPPA